MRKNILASGGLVIIFTILIIVFTTVSREGEQKVKREVVEFPQELIERVLIAEDGEEIKLHLAEGFDIALAAEGMVKPRFMDVSPDGRLFIADMKGAGDRVDGEVYILSGFDFETKKFTSRTTYLSNLRNPHDVDFYTDQAGETWIYIATTDRITRFRYESEDNAPTSLGETVATFPTYGLSAAQGGWHITRTMEFMGDDLYVSVGSSCNKCEENPDEIRAEIVVMDPDGSNLQDFARGLRNAVGLTTREGELYATNMGSDRLGNDLPDDTFFRITENTHYGWPYCYHAKGEPVTDTTMSWQREPVNCREVPSVDAYFEAHSAPLGVAYIENDLGLNDTFLAALHGSGNVALRREPKVVAIQNGEVNDFLTGFLSEEGARLGRPAGVHNALDTFGGIFVTDDYTGRLYFIY